MANESPTAENAPVDPEHHHGLNTASRNLSAIGISVGVHAVIFTAMFFIREAVFIEQPKVQIESVMSEERLPEEITQQVETDEKIAETMNTVSGGLVSTTVGSATGPIVNRTRIETSTVLKDPKITVNVGDITMPGDSLLGVDLGEGKVRGEVGAFVEGYGAALGRITQELIRLMRQDPVLVVWLFDESESMKDDQAEISQKFHKVYEELGIVTKKDADLKKKGQDILLTSIVGFGEKYHPLTSKPTSDISEIRAAIDKIAIDESGLENMCAAIAQAIAEHRQLATRQKRKLVLVVVSDESGDDGGEKDNKLEVTLDMAKKANAPIYVLGRESIFGYPFARIRWQDPQYKLWHWLMINRGPETAYRECLQWDGLHARWDSFSSGFGPYEQVRLAKETGGIFFVLPGEEENLTGAGAKEKRQFEALDMKEYVPLLVSRREYQREVMESVFRSTVSEVIRILDPAIDGQLNIAEHHYKLDIEEFKTQAAREVVKAQRAMTGLNQVLPMFEKIQPLRAREPSQRWRANFDLIHAQLYAYRIRLFQFLLAMDDHVRKDPKPTKADSNEWWIGRSGKMIEPDAEQYEALKKAFKLKTTREEYLNELKDYEQKAREMFQAIIEEHPRTPWARRAEYELSLGFGMQFRDVFWDPKYYKNDIKFPKL